LTAPDAQAAASGRALEFARTHRGATARMAEQVLHVWQGAAVRPHA
jgi:hypothetical protein